MKGAAPFPQLADRPSARDISVSLLFEFVTNGRQILHQKLCKLYDIYVARSEVGTYNVNFGEFSDT